MENRQEKDKVIKKSKLSINITKKKSDIDRDI